MRRVIASLSFSSPPEKAPDKSWLNHLDSEKPNEKVGICVFTGFSGQKISWQIFFLLFIFLRKHSPPTVFVGCTQNISYAKNWLSNDNAWSKGFELVFCLIYIPVNAYRYFYSTFFLLSWRFQL